MCGLQNDANPSVCLVYLSILKINWVQINGAGVVVVIMDSVVAWIGWFKIVSYFIVASNFSSKLGVAKTLKAALRYLAVKFNVLVKRLLDQFLGVPSRLVGP